MENGVDRVAVGGKDFAVIIRSSYQESGIKFFTPPHYSQQLGYMNHPKGYKIAPHLHKEVNRIVTRTLEALFVKRGRVRVDFYDDSRTLQAQREIQTGDVILLIAGGHGFEVLEDSEMIEVKQGPFAGDEDKVRF